MPATAMVTFTNRGLGVAATSDTLGGKASCRTFLSKVMISPLARSGGRSMCRLRPLFAMLVLVAHDDVAGRSVDHHVQRALEGWPFLHEMIADQLKMPALRKRSRLVFQRSIFEVVDETARDAIASRVLNEIAVGQHRALR